MKLKYIIPAAMLAMASVLTSCEDMMDLKSDSYVYDEDNKLDSANDSLYSAMGILTQLQKIGERYVLMGELRGDLMSVTADAPVSMQEIANFNVSASNTYNAKRDYYGIINNCNYALARMDTMVTEHLNRVMVPEYVAIKTLRAWTYLQMGLTYGRVQWIDRPILSLEESEMDYPVVELDALVDKLVADLERYAANRVPDYGSVDGLDSRRFFIEPRVLLGDLYLYRNQYAQAAQMYYDYIRNHEINIITAYANTWSTSQANAIGMETFLESYLAEAVAEIPYSSETKHYHPDLVNLTYNASPQLVPAEWWVNELATTQHFHIDREGISMVSGFLEGDLRGRFMFANGSTQAPTSFGGVATSATSGSNEMLITKFYNVADENSTLTNPENPLAAGHYVRALPIYRYSHVYLRYAEALNRLGKPTLAFAVLKHGLRPEVMADETKVNPEELADELPWTNFTSTVFENNRGTAMRGRGLGIDLQQSTYVIPEFDTPQETMEWVEDAIVAEMAAETQFEGNRFFDLVRVSRHRGGTDYFAEKVSRRFPNPEAAKALLRNTDNWWLK